MSGAGDARAEGKPRGSFARAAGLTYATSIVGALLSLLNVVITSRALGPSGRGSVVFLTTLAMISSYVSSLGVEESAANLVGQRPDQRRAVASTTLVLALGLGLATALLVGAVMAIAPALRAGSDPPLLALALASVPLLIFQYCLQLMIRSDYGFAAVNVISLLTPAANVLVNGGMYAAGVISVQTAVTTWIVAQVVATLLLVAYVSRRLAGFGRPDRALAGDMLSFGIRAHGGRVMKTANMRLDQLLLGIIAGPRELGLYSVAVAWAEALFFLPEALTSVLRPDVVRSSGTDAGRQAAAVFRVSVLVTAPLAAGLVLFAPPLCTELFGPEFRGAIDDLRVLALGGFGICALMLLAETLIAQGRPLRSTIAFGVAFVVTIALDILLIPVLGGLGAAIASLTAYSAGGLAVGVIFVRALGISWTELVPGPSDARRLRAALLRR